MLIEVMHIAYLFWLAANDIQRLISSVCNFKITFLRHKMLGKMCLDIWILEFCLLFILRLESSCDEIGKYPFVFIAKAGNMCETRFLPFVAQNLQCIDFANVSTFH